MESYSRLVYLDPLITMRQRFLTTAVPSLRVNFNATHFLHAPPEMSYSHDPCKSLRFTPAAVTLQRFRSHAGNTAAYGRARRGAEQ
jgi:hypothetical protein